MLYLIWKISPYKCKWAIKCTERLFSAILVLQHYVLFYNAIVVEQNLYNKVLQFFTCNAVPYADFPIFSWVNQALHPGIHKACLELFHFWHHFMQLFLVQLGVGHLIKSILIVAYLSKVFMDNKFCESIGKFVPIWAEMRYCAGWTWV